MIIPIIKQIRGTHMKSRNWGFLVILVLLTALSPTQSASAQDAVEHPDVTIGVEGLACPICAYGLEKRLRKIDAIDLISVHIKDGEVRIALKEDSQVNEEQLREAVKDAGFTLTAITFQSEDSQSDGRRE
jgi:periplasmic mercuric ion binding protein